jgi:mannose-6-phosphate isomerase-like protein (cupin superfamily)
VSKLSSRKVVVKKSEFVPGAPMETSGVRGVRDLKVLYPETGVETKTLIMGIVEIEINSHSPLHRHNCEEVYYVLQGNGIIESDGVKYEFETGDAIYNKENTKHRVYNTGQDLVRLLVVGGIMFVGLIPDWPTNSPYEILE